jgi:hypothetical protein
MNERTGDETSDPPTSELNDPSRKLPREPTSSGTTNDLPNDLMNDTSETNERSGRRGMDTQGVGIGEGVVSRGSAQRETLYHRRRPGGQRRYCCTQETTRILDFGTRWAWEAMKLTLHALQPRKKVKTPKERTFGSSDRAYDAV